MFGRSRATADPEVVEVVQHIDVETYQVAVGADKIRNLEAEILSTFQEWMKAQKSSAEKQVLVEFAMSPWMAAAWSSWKAHQFTDGAETSVIPVPDKWPE